MIRNKEFLIGLVVLIYFVGRFFYTKAVLPGIYVNVNYENAIFSANFPDTLQIFRDGSLKSEYFRAGEYRIKPGFTNEILEVDYWNPFSRNSSEYEISFNFLGKPRIWLSPDSENHYKKIN